jgi:hypothetical protein
MKHASSCGCAGICCGPNLGSPLFAALQDQRLARAIIEVLERPASGHSMESLAGVAGMSRSSFAEQFTSVPRAAAIAMEMTDRDPRARAGFVCYSPARL